MSGYRRIGHVDTRSFGFCRDKLPARVFGSGFLCSPYWKHMCMFMGVLRVKDVSQVLVKPTAIEGVWAPPRYPYTLKSCRPTAVLPYTPVHTRSPWWEWNHPLSPVGIKDRACWNKTWPNFLYHDICHRNRIGHLHPHKIVVTRSCWDWQMQTIVP